jgi:endonuclease III
MANPNRTALLNKTHRVLKQHYKPAAPAADRPLLEHMLYACCLENAPYEVADKIYDHLSKSFFDWNEVRVSTLTELTEAMHSLPDPLAAASNLKRILQGVFESTYSFELETVKKQNISQAVKQLENLGGASPFVVAYITQIALSGHAIPLDRGALDVLYLLGIISQSESQTGKISGLERVIPKSKGVEFGSLLHQLAADYVANPFSPNIRKLILSINSDAKDRFPKRGAKKDPEKPPEPAITPTGKKKGPPEKTPERPPLKPIEKHREKHPIKHDEKKKPATAAAKASAAKPHPVSAKRKPATKQMAKRKPR